jgi:hypothetical protein
MATTAGRIGLDPMTRGEHIAQNIADYLTTNGLRKAALTRALVAEIADRTLVHLEQLEKKHKRLATEEDWIKEQEKDPAMQGVNVRAELAAAQFWAKNNGRQCTTRFFTNWLLNPKHRVIASAGGNAEKIVFDVYVEPVGWKDSEKARTSVYGTGVSRDTWTNLIREGWFQLGTDVRKAILKTL